MLDEPFLPEDESGALSSQIQRLAQARLRAISANREKLLEAWFAETNCKRSEAVLVEKPGADGTTRFWIERKEVETGSNSGFLRT